MAIPEIEVFEQFLRGTSIVDRKPPGPHVRLPTTDGGGLLYLAHPAVDITLDAVCKRIGDELRKNGCPSDSDIELALLGNIVDTWSGDGEVSAVAHANACLSTTHEVELQLHVVMPDPCRPGYEMTIEELTIRPFNPKSLLYWAGRGEVTYPYDLKKLAGRVALDWERFKTRLVDWDKIHEGCSLNVARRRGEPQGVHVADVYYTAVSAHYVAQIPALLESRLLVFEGGGLIRFETENFLYGLGSQHIGLFQWASNGKRRSWAVLSRVAQTRNLVPPDLLPNSRKWIEAETGFRKLDPSKHFDRTIETYCVFLRRAHGHRLARRYDEALLHFVVALELLFNRQEGATDSVSTRAAVVVHRPLGRSFEEQTKVLKKAYGARSMYVHRGESASGEGAMNDGEHAATQVLWALLAVSARGDCQNLEEWLVRIDRIDAALKHGFPIAEEDFAKAGISAASQPRVAPSRVLENAEIELPEIAGFRPIR